MFAFDARTFVLASVFHTVNIHSEKYFAILIFVALCDYENISTTKISRITVYDCLRLRNSLLTRKKHGNFAPAPRKIPVPQIVVAVECSLKKVEENAAVEVRQKVIGLLRKAKLPPSNITPSQREALNSLKKDTSVVILPADKGRATVLLDQPDYEQNMKKLLSDRSTYQVLKCDTMLSLQRKKKYMLLKL